MDILLFHTEKEKLKVLAFCLESQINVTVTAVNSLELTMTHLLGEGSVDLIVANDSLQLTLLMKYLLSVGSKIPLIIVGANAEQSKQKAFSEIGVIAQIKEG